MAVSIAGDLLGEGSEPSRSANPDLLVVNLAEVFGGSGASARRAAVQRLYAPDAVLLEAEGAFSGHEAIWQKVEAILAQVPTGFSFEPITPPSAHHGVGVLQWKLGPPGAAPVLIGTDVATFKDQRIFVLRVFLAGSPK